MAILIDNVAQFIVHAKRYAVVYYILDNMSPDKSSTFDLNGLVYRITDGGYVTDPNGIHIELTADQVDNIIRKYDPGHKKTRQVMDLTYGQVLNRSGLSIDQYVNWVLDAKPTVEDTYDWNGRYK